MSDMRVNLTLSAAVDGSLSALKSNLSSLQGATDGLTTSSSKLGAAQAKTGAEAQRTTRSTTGLTSATRATGSALSNITQQATQAGKSFSSLSQQHNQAITDLKSGLGGLASTAAIGGTLRKGFAQAFEIEGAAVRLRTVINDPNTDPAMQKSLAHARDYALNNIATENEILSIEYALNSAGLAADTARVAATVTDQVAKVTGGAAEATGEVLATVYNNLGRSMQGTDEEKFARVGDILAKTQLKFQLKDFNQLGESLNQGAAAMSTYNVPLEQGVTLLGLLNTAGKKGGSAGTALNAVMRGLSKAQEELGMEIVRTSNGELDMIATLESLESALDGLGIDERAVLLTKAFGDEGMSGIDPMLRELKNLKGALDEVTDGSRGIVKEKYELFNEARGARVGLLFKNLSTLSTQISESLGPVVDLLVTPANEAVKLTSELLEHNQGLARAAGLVGVAIAGWGLVKMARSALSLLGGLRSVGRTLPQALPGLHYGRGKPGKAGSGRGLAGLGAVGAIPVTVTNWPIGFGRGGRRGKGKGKGGKAGAAGTIGGTTARTSVRDRIAQGGGARRVAADGLGGLGGGAVANAAKPGILSRLGSGMKRVPWLGTALTAASVGATFMDDNATTDDKVDAVSEGGGALVGGIAGAKLGGLAGAALGSIVPGIGTAIGGAVGATIGGIGGAFAGSALGQTIGDTVKGWFKDDPVAKATPPVAPPPPPPGSADKTKAGDTNQNVYITVNAAPGMNEQQLTNLVDKKFREQAGRSAANAALYD